MSDLSPYARARALAESGIASREIAARLISEGVEAEEAKVAAHAVRDEQIPPVVGNDFSVGVTLFSGPGLVFSWTRGSWFDAQIQLVLGGATLLSSVIAMVWAMARPDSLPALLFALLALCVGTFLFSRIIQSVGVAIALVLAAAVLWAFRGFELLPLVLAAFTAFLGVVHLVSGLALFRLLEKARHTIRPPETTEAPPQQPAQEPPPNPAT